VCFEWAETDTATAFETVAVEKAAVAWAGHRAYLSAVVEKAAIEPVCR
jgi:hypothetical protein